MKIEFDPQDMGEVRAVTTMVNALHNLTEIPGTGPTTPVTEVSTVAASTPAAPAPIADAEPPVVDNDDVPTAAPINGGQVDCHGMTHNPEIHSTPPKITAKGAWQQKRGQKEAYEAAIAAHKAQQANAAGQAMVDASVAPAAPVQQQTAPVAPVQQPTNVVPLGQTAPAAQTPQPGQAPVAATPQPEQAPVVQTPVPAPTGGMPAPQAPATPAPNTPQPPFDYDQLGARFAAMIDSGKIVDFNAVYAHLSLNFDTLATDQRALGALCSYMDALDAGHDHNGAVQAALAAFPAQ